MTTTIDSFFAGFLDQNIVDLNTGIVYVPLEVYDPTKISLYKDSGYSISKELAKANKKLIQEDSSKVAKFLTPLGVKAKYTGCLEGTGGDYYAWEY